MPIDKYARGMANKANITLDVITNNGQIKGFIVLTQAEYDALVAANSVDLEIVYLISG